MQNDTPTATLVADFALTISTDSGRKLLPQASGTLGIGVGDIQTVTDYRLDGPLELGEVRCFVCLQASHNVMLELTSSDESNPVPQNFRCGKFYLAYVAAANFRVKPISDETYVSLFFY